MGILSTNESAEQIFIQLLNECDIPCTYSHIRGVLGWLTHKWQGAKPNNKKLWSLLWPKLSTYEVRDEDTDILYVLCQVARVLKGGTLQKTRSRLVPQSSYAVGIAALLPNHSESITLQKALEYLLVAYKYDKALDIKIALLIVYEELGYFNLRRSLLPQIVSKLAQNLNWLLKIPLPSSKYYHVFYDKGTRNNVPGLNQPLEQVAKKIQDIINNSLHIGKIEELEEQLKRIRNRVRSIQMPELELNLAICRTLHKDFDGALYHLEQIVSNLDNVKSINISPIRQAYYQLTMYVYYKLGRFQQVQNVVAKAVQQDLQPWLKTWLGYVFFANGNYQLSQEVIQPTNQSVKKDRRKANNQHNPIQENQPSQSDEDADNQTLENLLKGNILGQEYILLYLYWQDIHQIYPSKLEAMKLLRQLIFKPSSSEWTQPNSSVRFFPAPQHLDIENIVKNAQQYDAPDYLLYKYNSESGAQDLSVDDHKLAELALHAANFQKAKEIWHNYWLNNPRNEQAVDFVISFYEALLLPFQDLEKLLEKNPKINRPEILKKFEPRIRELQDRVNKLLSTPPLVLDKKEYPTNNKVRNLIERWMKSPYERDLIGEKLVNLLNQSQALQNLYWGRKDLREQIWQALDVSIDYGCVEDILPSYLTLEALSDTVFHLLYVGKRKLVEQLIERTREQFKQNNNENRYFKLLEQLNQEETSVNYHRKLYYLRLLSGLSKRSPLPKIEPLERKEVISALQILAQYPDVNQQAAILLLLGELQVLEDEYQAASESYTKVALEIDQIKDTSRLIAALRLMCLCALVAKISLPEKLITQGYFWQIAEKPIGKLLAPLAELLNVSQSQQERESIAKMLSSLQLLIEVLQDKEKYEIEPIQSILNALKQLPKGTDFALHLYETFIGINPLQGEHPEDKNLKDIFYLFSDFELGNQLSGELEKKIKATLKVIVDKYEDKASTTYQGKDYNLRNEWRKLKKSLESQFSGKIK
ncbi:MAG: hypothetical protein F6J86_13165 [Symploca sp. SIO1B1]|nr:hypothetical protein [Symploca sp. SIO1B1]